MFGGFWKSLGKYINIHCKSNPVEQLKPHFYIEGIQHYKSSFFFLLLAIHFRSGSPRPAFTFTSRTRRHAKPISSCISLIREFNMCHPVGGEPPWHVHNTHTHKHTAPSWQLTLITGPACRMACISAKSRSHVTPSSMPLVGGERGGTMQRTHPLPHTLIEKCRPIKDLHSKIRSSALDNISAYSHKNRTCVQVKHINANDFYVDGCI